MKNNLGKKVSFIFVLLTFTLLYAEDFTYSFHVDNKQPYVKEAVILTLDLNQSNHNLVLLFNFSILKSKDYSFQRVDIKESDSYHHAKVHYVYLLYPLKAGDIKINFKLLKKTTTDDSVAYSFSGDRDNVKGLETKDTHITLPPLHLKVKALPTETALVGDFFLSYKVKKHQAKAYEPLPLQVNIKGLGYLPLLDSLLPKDVNFTRFTQKPIVQSSQSVKGTQSTVTYPLALSHNKSFTLSPIILKAFNPKTQKSYALTVPSQEFTVLPIDKKTLIDSIDSPTLIKTDWSGLKTLLGYLVVFGAGYFTAFTWKWKKKNIKKSNNPLKEKVKNCKDEKALLQLLLATDAQYFSVYIEKLESALYANGTIKLSQVKQEIMEKKI